jgi:peroxiredoxin
MRKIVFAVLISGLLYSCTSENYKINGTSDIAELNGKTIYIKENIDELSTTIDSTTISNGSFTFDGKADSARIVYLYCDMPTGEVLLNPFVLENGKITINLNAGLIKIGGTPQNDILQQYNDKKKEITAEAKKTYNQLSDTTLTEAQKKATEAKLMTFDKKMTLTDIKFSTENVNSLVGTYIFTSSYYNMSFTDKEKIVSLMNSSTKNQKHIIEIIKSLEIERRSAKGQPFIDFSLPDTEGKIINLSSFIGKTDYVLIDFWASWCLPCMQSMPELKQLYNKYKGSKLEVIGISLDEEANVWEKALKINKLNWIQLSDLKGWESQGAIRYAISSIPSTVLIDRKGTIIGRDLSIPEIEMILNKY